MAAQLLFSRFWPFWSVCQWPKPFSVDKPVVSAGATKQHIQKAKLAGLISVQVWFLMMNQNNKIIL